MARRRTRSIFHTATTVRTAAEPGFNEEGGVDTGWGDLTYLVPNPDDFPDGPTMEEWLDSLPADQKMVLPESWLDAQASRSAELRQREVAILQAMGKATLPEQRQLLAELNAIRTERTALHQAARQVDLANATIRDHLVPVASLGARSSAKSDWLSEVPTYAPGDLTHTMVAEASLFYRGLDPMVKADTEELVIQSLGKARQVAAQFESRAKVAIEAFMEEIVRLAEAQPAAEPAEDGAAESSLPVAVNPSDAPETFDEDTLAISDSQMADSDFAQKYQSTAAVLAAMNDTMWARLGYAETDDDDDYDAVEIEWGKKNDDTKDDAEDTGGDTEEEDEDDDDSPFPKESTRKTASYMEIAGAYGRDYKSLKDAKADWDANKDFQILDVGPNMGRYINKAQLSELPAGTTLMVRFKAMTEVREIAKSSARRTAVSLTNVGLDGENGIGTDPQGNRVRFKLSPQDRKDLSAVLFSDMAVNFTGVDVEESDIIRSASRRTASGDYCPKCGSSESTMQASGTQKCNSCGHEHLQYQRTDKKSARRTASVVDTLRQIVEQKQHQKINGQIIDLFSASMILGVLDALNPENQATFTKIIEANPAQAAEVAAKLTNKATAAKTAAEKVRIDGRTTYKWNGLWAADASDNGPEHSINRGYDPNCSWCWLGYGHTEAEHAKKLAEAGPGPRYDDPQFAPGGQGTWSKLRRQAAKGQFRIQESTGTSSGKPFFTLQYMAPEDSWAYGVWEDVKSSSDRAELEAFQANPPEWWGATASRRTAADEPSDTGAAESTLPVAVNPSDAPEGLDQLTDGSGDAPSGAAAGSPTTFADFVADRSKLSAFRQRVAATQDRGSHPFVREAMPNPVDLGVKVGDIFVSSWGYDQTNIDFYEVVGLTGASVKVRKVAKEFISRGGPAGNKVMPRRGQYIGEVMTKRIRGGDAGWSTPSFDVSSYATAFLWDGQPETETDSLYGH